MIFSHWLWLISQIPIIVHVQEEVKIFRKYYFFFGEGLMDFYTFMIFDVCLSVNLMIVQMNMAISDSEDYTPKVSKKLQSLFECSLPTKFSLSLENNVQYKTTYDDEELTKHLKNLNL